MAGRDRGSGQSGLLNKDGEQRRFDGAGGRRLTRLKVWRPQRRRASGRKWMDG